MRDERKKQARSNKQTRQSNTAHPRQSLFLYMYMNNHVYVQELTLHNYKCTTGVQMYMQYSKKGMYMYSIHMYIHSSELYMYIHVHSSE